MTTLQIRRIESEDAAAIRELYSAKTAYGNTLHLPDPTLDMWSKRLSKIPDFVNAYVALIDNDIVGNLGLTVITRDRQRHIATFGMAVK